MVALLVGTYLWYPRDAFVGRYDFLFLMALAIFGLNRAYIMILFTSSAGRILIGIALFMMSIGALIIKKIVSFKG